MRRYVEVLRHEPFAVLWLGSTLSAIGDTLTWVALVWLTIEVGGVEAVARLVVASTVPVIVGGLVMGSLLDRFDRRSVLIAVNAVLGVTVAIVPVLSYLGRLRPWHLIVVASTYGLLKMANWAGVPSLIPSLVPEEHLTTANALESATFGIAEVAGPAVAGVLIATIGGENVLAVDAATYLLFVGVLLRLRVPREAPGAPPSGGSKLSLRPAFAFAFRQPAVRATTLMFMAANLGEGMLLVLLPTFARRTLGGDAQTFGLLLSAFAISVTIGSFVVGALEWRWSLGRSIAVTQTAAGLSFLGLTVASDLVSAVAVLVVVGAFVSPMTVWAQTIRMRLIPAELRGRAFGVLRTLMQSTPPLGGALAGAILADRGSIGLATVCVGLLIGVPGAIGLLLPGLGERYARSPASPGHGPAVPAGVSPGEGSGD